MESPQSVQISMIWSDRFFVHIESSKESFLKNLKILFHKSLCRQYDLHSFRMHASFDRFFIFEFSNVEGLPGK